MDPLQSYAETRDERAFRALVDAHLGMVYGTAMRRLGDPQLSEEVAQNVFNALAKKAKTIRSAAALPAWLHRATVLESSKAIRGESRRRQRMEKLIEITALEGDGLAAWKHAQHDLDEAVDELPAADREVLFQRFYEDMSYREIASASGKSEAASQKQASRAIAKLGELMRARGFAVPATVLAAGLTTELGKAAPAKLAATVSSTALAGAATSSINILGIMSVTKSTATGTAAAIALIAAFAGGGYLSGRSSAKADLADSRSEPLSPDSPTSGATPGDEGGPVTATSNQTRGSVREILQAAAAHYANTSEDPDATDKAEREIAKLRPDEIETALSELAMLETDPKSIERTRWGIVKHWSRSDGPAAAGYALDNSADDEYLRGITSALYGWGSRAPEETFAWYREHIGGGQVGANVKESALRTVMRAWGAKDPQAALAEMAQLSYDEQRKLASSMDVLAREEATREPYLAALSDYPKGPVYTKLLKEAVDEWSRRDAAAAAAWFDTLEFDSPTEALDPAFELAENWFEQDPRAAVDWAWQKVPEHIRGEFVNDFVRRGWGERDKEGATAWLEANGFEGVE